MITGLWLLFDQNSVIIRAGRKWVVADVYAQASRAPAHDP